MSAPTTIDLVEGGREDRRTKQQEEHGIKGEAKPAPARLVRVDQETIDVMLKQAEQLPPSRPFPDLPESKSMDRMRPGYRAQHARIAAMMKRSDDRDADILHQYRTKGYADIELTEEELSDDEL